MRTAAADTAEPRAWVRGVRGWIAAVTICLSVATGLASAAPVPQTGAPPPAGQGVPPVQAPPGAPRPPGPPPVAPGPPATLRVFLDCDRCDSDYMTTNVAFVDYVRDRTVADLHVLVTTESTGSGGLSWTVAFLGQGRYANHDHTMTFTTGPTATADDQRREVARVIKLGLVFFVADTPAASRLNVTFDAPAESAQTTARKDPWNFWLFQLNANGSFNGQQSTTSHYYSFNTTANRTTDEWKLNFSANSNQNRSAFVLDDGSTVSSFTSGWSASQLIVRSVNAHWSIGGTASALHSTFSNEDRVFRVAPGVEFDVFPYKESTRRILTVLYTVGASHYDYESVTIFGKLKETIPEHAVTVGLTLKEPWGSLSETTAFTQQITNLARYRLSSSTSADIRLFKGFSFSVYFEYDRIRNQTFLPAGGASTTDILLQVQQLATGYSYSGSIGLTYTFGSIFNNIVNPRFTGAS